MRLIAFEIVAFDAKPDIDAEAIDKVIESKSRDGAIFIVFSFWRCTRRREGTNKPYYYCRLLIASLCVMRDSGMMNDNKALKTTYYNCLSADEEEGEVIIF